MRYQNPVLPGFYPDPSVCKYGDKYYLVTSSFQFFPGVPLFESDDLVNWTQIGHVLTRKSQLPLEDASNSDGIYAPTIRVNNGRFYMVTTNVSSKGNFYVWTDDIYGEWSEPVWVERDGIDPSLYFEDGKCYFMSNGTDAKGDSGVTQCEIDIETGKVLSEVVTVWHGTGGRFLESPHLYKFKDTYYLMAAEGGTEYGHMVVMAYSDNIYGPFTEVKNNPILTNRNLGGYELQGCGHGDLVEDNNGNIWMVHLGFRQIGKWLLYHTIGRETCLVPVTIAGDEVYAGYKGTTTLTVDTERLPDDLVQKKEAVTTFKNTRPGREWIYIRYPRNGKYLWQDERVYLFGVKDKLDDDLAYPTFMGIRQKQPEGKMSVIIEACGDNEAGVTLYMDNEHHMDIGVKKTRGGRKLFKHISIGDLSVVTDEFDIPAEGEIRVDIVFEKLHYGFRATVGGKEYDLGKNQSRYLSTEVAGGFTGVLIGLYAQTEIDDSDTPAIFSDLKIEY